MQAVTGTNGLLAYDGHLHVGKQGLPARITIPDMDFVHLPKIHLLSRPTNLPLGSGHIGADGDICYASGATSRINLYDAPRNVVRCLEDAEHILEQDIHHNAFVDTNHEFHAYWSSVPILVDCASADITNCRNLIGREIQFANASRAHWILTPESDKCVAKYKQVGATFLRQGVSAYLIKLSESPRVWPEGWPIKNMKQFSAWLAWLDPQGSGQLLKKLTEFHKSDMTAGIFVFMHDTSWFAFRLNVLHKLRNHFRSGRAWAQDVTTGIQSSNPIDRYSAVRIDDDYIVNRNLASKKSLIGKKIILGGAGTIGGYLADMLVKLGGGLGGGQLVIVDPGLFEAGNIGRHILGFESLMRPKAEALKEFLLKRMPDANIHAEVGDVRIFLSKRHDIIVDATGEESLSIALNAMQHEKGLPPILYSWIVGQGIATQCLFVDGLEYACYACTGEGDERERFSPSQDKLDPYVQGTGCDAFLIPFPVSAAVQAAALAADALLDWAAGDPSPRLRTRRIIFEKTKEVHDQNPNKRAGCPACSK